MRALSVLSLALVCVASTGPMAAGGDALAPQAPQIKIPEPGVPQVMTLEGEFVRVAYNNEGYAIIGYKLANLSVGEEWMLLEFGTTLRDGAKDYTMTRDKLSLETPDGRTIPMATVMEYRGGNLTALQNREKVQRDSINYFPPSASQACRIGFFSELSDRAMAYDQVELTSRRGCIGRLFFKVPGGITYGQHWLNVRFQNGVVRVPFRILTKEEEKLLSKNYKDIRRQVEDTFKKK